MSFSALTCITFTGTTPLGPTIYFYSNIDGFVSSFANAPLSSLVGENCPYTITGIPDGTTTVRFKDPTTNCCVDIPVSPTIDLCVFCDFGFNEYSATTVSEIVAGDLTGTCDTNITDYVVNWYGPGIGSTNVALTSGKGDTFNYGWTHPLTGDSSVLITPGIYTPVVESVVINGTPLYDNLGATAECFDPITVDPFTCSNGTPIYDYEHRIVFSNSSGGIPPTLTSYFVIDATTNYFAWAFQGVSVEDTLKISYSGTNYTTPIVVEYITLGNNVSGYDLNINTTPKYGSVYYFYAKVNCLTGFTYSSGDILILEVIPNQLNTNTDWDMYFTCLETFNCDTCLETKTPYKIIQSSITGLTGSCDTIRVNFNLSGCSKNTNDTYDIFKYYMPSRYPTPYLVASQFYYNLRDYVEDTGSPSSDILQKSLPIYSPTSNFTYNSSYCSNQTYYYNQYTCTPQTPNTISLKSYALNSSQRKIELRFSDVSDFDAYINTYNTAMVSSGSTNPFNINYYRKLGLVIPTPEGSVPCGDGTPPISINLHPPTLILLTGTSVTPENYTIDITASTISNELSFSSCDLNCNGYIDSMVYFNNLYVTGSSSNFTGTTTSGSRYNYPFWILNGFSSGSTSYTAETTNGSISIPQYSNETYAYSGDPLTPIPSLSAITCNNLESKMTFINDAYGVDKGNLYLQYVYDYRVELTNPSDIRDFRIYASPITNGTPSGYPSPIFSDFVYGFSGGSVYHTNPTYLI